MAEETHSRGTPPDVVEIDIGTLRKSGLARLDMKVIENIVLVALASALARAGDREKAVKLAEELERRLGIPVRFGSNTEGVYPVLVIDTSDPRYAAWLIAKDRVLGYPWDYIELKLGVK